MEEIGDSVACPVCGNIQKYEQENKQFLNPSTMIGQYMVGNVLGAGGFGVTYVGFDTKLSRKVAIKEYFPSNLSTRVPGQTHVTAFTGEKQTVFNHGKQRFIEEAQLLMRFANEEGIVSVYDVIEANGTVYTQNTADIGADFLAALAAKDNLLVCMAIISMSDISFAEMQEKLKLSEENLRIALDVLIGAKIVIEKESKHKSLGFTYEISSMYHSCLCILIATIEILRYGLADGVSCCMGFGDYPIQFDK